MVYDVFITILTGLLVFLPGNMAASSADVKSFFPSIKGNLTKITWAHAVNNKTYLESTLKDNNIMMIEADIVLGKVNNTGSETPIMGHPPNNVSDISLNEFLAVIDDFNTRATNTTQKKGVKLDFKTIEVFNRSLDVVKSFDKGNYPLWINADILPGPINASTTPVNAGQFLQNAKVFNTSVLSIGWTTNYGSNMTGSYSNSDVESMIKVIDSNNVTQEITFPVRAGLAAESIDQLKNLTSKVANSTLTIWSSDGDRINITNLRSLIGKIGINRTFIDIPDKDVYNQLHLDQLPSGASSLVPFSAFVGVLSHFMAYLTRKIFS